MAALIVLLLFSATNEAKEQNQLYSVQQQICTKADVTEADVAEADVAEADVVEADVAEADVTEADVAEADVDKNYTSQNQENEDAVDPCCAEIIHDQPQLSTDPHHAILNQCGATSMQQPIIITPQNKDHDKGKESLVVRAADNDATTIIQSEEKKKVECKEKPAQRFEGYMQEKQRKEAARIRQEAFEMLKCNIQQQEESTTQHENIVAKLLQENAQQEAQATPQQSVFQVANRKRSAKVREINSSAAKQKQLKAEKKMSMETESTGKSIGKKLYRE